uniref:Glycine cleavage system H protein n=1 Tax=Lotharella globosa TaxID=91324 RepID=A0A6V3RD17_9EUKA|mmetsp:Transcript_4766/g.9274  ORF Transcript_4766/g.9274 Transcript_4766/m.9274 type:complete len:149 (-) Transcript_4766:286-732(-)
MRLSRTIRVVRRTAVASRSLGNSRAFSTFYTKDHEYLKAEGDIYIMGISDHAQQELGDVVFVELPETGSSFEQGEACGSVESVKAASSIYAPVDIEVVEANDTLEDNYSLVNESAEAEGWMVKVKVTNPDQLGELMDADAYAAHCAAE